MSALDLSRYETTIRRCVATLLHASYTDGIPTETTDAWRTFAADASRDLTAIVTRLRAAEARTAWQPIETAPLWPDRSPTPLWIVGQRVARPPVTVAQTAPGVYVDEYGNRQHVTAWAPLPAAPEAP